MSEETKNFNIKDIMTELVNSNYNDCQFTVFYDENYDVEITMKKLKKSQLWVKGTFDKTKNTYQM